MMSEKEKCKKGMLYDANYDQDLLDERNYCKDECFKFNQLLPSQKERQDEIIKNLFGEVGESFVVTAPFWCDYGYNIKIGNNFYVNHNCVILDGASITFGEYVFIGPNCCFSTAGHPIDKDERNQGLEFAYPITVGNNVWIGAGVSVLPGVTIGDNSIIGAGSVVTKDIPSDVIAVGNPCKVLRKITSSDKEKYK